MRINFIFCRHGYGCHNAISPLVKQNTISIEDARPLFGKITDNQEENDKLFIDPELTEIGVDASVYNGCIVSKTIRKIGFDIFKKDEFSSINIVGCSPLIRSMETAYQMTKLWTKKPDKIYVFPYLREIDEMSTNKYSEESKKTMDTNPSYAMKSLDKQKEYLKSVELDNIIDFSFIEKNLEGRSEAGDIPRFVSWFTKNILPNIETKIDTLNVFIITHAGVLSDFVKKNISEKKGKQGYYNNSGFVISITNEKNQRFEIDKFISLLKYLPNTFFKNYSAAEYVKGNYYCPSKRCSNFCKYIKHDASKEIDKIKTKTCSNTDQDNLSV